MKEQLEKFSIFLLAEKGFTNYTKEGYVRGVRRFLRSAAVPVMECSQSKAISGSGTLNLGIRKPTFNEIKIYIASMYIKNASYSHIVNTSLAIEHYMEFMGTPIRLGRPKKPKRIIMNVLSEAEIARLIGAAKNIREQTIVALLAYSGIRSRELCGVLVSDLDSTNQSIRIINGKHAKSRYVCVSPECLTLLLRYLEKYPRSGNNYLFTTLNKCHRYSPGDLRKLLRVVAARINFTRRIYPHLLRHSLATNMLNRGASLVTIQQQLGHTSLETTMIYLHQVLRKTRSEYQMFAPNYL